MSKVGHRKFRRRSETGAIQILEESFHLIRSADVKCFWIYYLGAVPFALALLYFVADMSRSSLAERDAAFAAVLMTGLYLWMHYCRARFCAGLWETINPGSLPARTRRGTFRSLSALWLLQAFQFPLVILGLFFAIPLGWILAMLQNFSVLTLTRDHEGKPFRSILGGSIRFSHWEWAQNHGILLIFFFVALFTWVNIIASSVLVPSFGKSIFGIESVFTLSPSAAVLNTTFLFGTFLITQLVISPLMQSAYVLRCFYASSRTSGADLLSRLADCRRKREEILRADPGNFSKVGLILFLLVVAGASGGISEESDDRAEPIVMKMDAERLQSEIEKTLEQKQYQWRLSRRTAEVERAEEQSWMAQRLAEIEATAKRILNAVEKWVEDMFRRMMERQMSGRNFDDEKSFKFFKELSATASLAFVALILGLLLWLAVSYYRRYRGSEKVAGSEEGGTGPIDLESEDIVATQLREDEWLLLAREQIAKGEERLAVRALFLATLAHLGERGLLRIARFKSNRDYRSELAVRARNFSRLRDAFDENTTLFERVWYGLHRLGEGAVENFLKNHETIAGESAGIGQALTSPAKV